LKSATSVPRHLCLVIVTTTRFSNTLVLCGFFFSKAAVLHIYDTTSCAASERTTWHYAFRISWSDRVCMWFAESNKNEKSRFVTKSKNLNAKTWILHVVKKYIQCFRTNRRRRSGNVPLLLLFDYFYLTSLSGRIPGARSGGRNRRGNLYYYFSFHFIFVTSTSRARQTPMINRQFPPRRRRRTMDVSAADRTRSRISRRRSGRGRTRTRFCFFFPSPNNRFLSVRGEIGPSRARASHDVVYKRKRRGRKHNSIDETLIITRASENVGWRRVTAKRF